MSFLLVPKSVTLNDLEQHNGRYFALFHRIEFVYDVVVKQLPWIQNLLLIVCGHNNTICALRNYSAIIWAKQILITRFDGRRRTHY